MRTTIVPEHPSGGPPAVLTLIESEADHTGSYLPRQSVAPPAMDPPDPAMAIRINAAWQEVAVPVAVTTMGGASLAALAEAWTPEQCESVEAMARAVDQAWAWAVPHAVESTLVISTSGLAPAAAATILETAERAFEGAEESPELGQILRFTGIVLCAATGSATSCGRIRHELEGVPEIPDAQWLGALGTRLQQALPPSDGITVAEFLQDWDVRVRSEPIGDGTVPSPAKVTVPQPVGPIGLTRAATAATLDGPSQIAVFGEP